MIRYVDISAADTGYRFAWFDTVTSTFKLFGGEQAWDSWDDFAEVHRGPDLERYRGLYAGAQGPTLSDKLILSLEQRDEYARELQRLVGQIESEVVRIQRVLVP